MKKMCLAPVEAAQAAIKLVASNPAPKPIYVTQTHLPPLEEFIPYLQQIWDNKILTNDSPFYQQLDQALCDYLSVKHLVPFINGTIALATERKAVQP